MDIATAAGAAAAAAARDPGREEEASLLIKEEREEESRPEVQAAVIVKCEEQEESVGSEVGGVAAGNEVEVSVDSRGERDASSQGWAEVEVELEDSDGDDGGGVGGGRSKRQQHPCLDCGKTFVSIGGLRRHAQLHGIKRPCRERGRILTSDRDRRTRCQSHRQPRRPKSPTADGGRACPGRASAESRRHLCGVCGRGFPWLCYLRSHERRHVLSGPRRRAVCAECGEVFSGQRELARHRQGHARGPLGQSASAQPGEGAGGGGAAAAEGTPATTLFLCDACDRAFPSHGELVEHRASHDGGGRGERGSTLPSASKLSRRRKIRSGELCRPHPRRHRRAGERASERGRAFRRPSGLRRHRGRRPNARPDAPGAATEPTDAAGDGRGRDDGAGGAHVCGECGRGFRWPSYLKRHGRTHTGERPHVCGRCGKGFYQSSNLKKHLGVHDRERPEPKVPNGRGPPPWEESGEEGPPRLSHQGARGDLCGEARGGGSARAAELAAQRDGRSDVKTLGSPRPDEPLDREADEVPPRHESKRRAAALPAPDELPAGDGREGVSPTGAEGREAPGAGGGSGAHVCAECGQGFRWLSYLTRHRRTHTGDRPHACAECGKGFSQPSDLRRHRRLHATERPGAAPAAASEGAVSRPTVLEESEPPPPPLPPPTPDGDDCRRQGPRDASRELVCTECGQAFACASSLNRHRRAHLGVRPHACAECDRAFLQASDLRRHQKVHGAGRPNARTRRPREPATRGGVVDAHRNEEPGVGGGAGEAGGAFASGECVEGHGEERSGDGPLEREEPPKASIARQSEDPSRGRWCAGNKRGEPAVQPPGFVGESQAATQFGERSCSRGERASGEVGERLRASPSAEGPARARGDSIEASPANGDPERRPTSHAESRAHVCDDCGQEFRWLSYLKRHRRTHTGERQNVCGECGKAFYQPSDLTKHRRTHGTARPHVCGRCGRGFATPEKLAAHRGVHAGERPHVCPECGKTFAFADNLRKHAKIHARDKPPPCELCGRGFETFYRLSRHRKVHSGEYPHVCDECGEGFPCASHLRKHQWAHGGQKAYACGDCSKAFARASELKRHRRVHAGDPPRPVVAESRSSPPSSAAPVARPDEAPHGGGAADAEKQRQHAHACDDCGQGFPLRSLLARHRRGAHGGTERRHACEECGRDFLRLSDLKKHARTHSSERPYACEVCGKGFVSSSRLRTHREIHSGERPYPCAVCGKRFAQPHGLGCHLKLHSGVRPHVCKECGEAFFWLSALKRHQMKHTGERPHVCQECGKGFTLVYRLKKHQKIHAAKLYLCDECGKGFTWHSSLRVHKRVHSREKPYVCEECGVRFAEPSNLKTHLRTHTGDRPYACEECGRRFSQSANLKRHRATHRPAPKAPAQQQQQQRGDAAAPIAEAGMELGTCQ